jgi:hypothetical protein
MRHKMTESLFCFYQKGNRNAWFREQVQVTRASVAFFLVFQKDTLALSFTRIQWHQQLQSLPSFHFDNMKALSCIWIRDTSVGIDWAMGWTLEESESILVRDKIFVTSPYRPDRLGVRLASYPGAISPGVKLLGTEDYHSCLSSAEV